ncbi:hypothetical protein L1049_020843 [Liquidambar formosana]|uniref:DUF4371 domain-containing protein n=1 Tax=Liquidambar formosana TaxID=63359 RepID=A0AAP0SDB2_LIQFO
MGFSCWGKKKRLGVLVGFTENAHNNARLAFRSHNESEDSINRKNFLKLLTFLAKHNEEVDKVVLKSPPKNLKVIAHGIQKQIVRCAASATIDMILDDLGHDLFSVLVDESRDISTKEQMAVMSRFVNKKGCVVERFLCLVYVSNTTALSLKEAINSLFTRHNLSVSSLRGQDYDGASNMSGEFNGLKSLIMKENPCAFYVHCFAHQLQSALIAVTKYHN